MVEHENPPSLRDRGKRDRRLRILDAATRLLRRGGLEALSMRALAEEAGVSVPTIYNLVGGRDEVLVAVLERMGAIFEAEAAALGGEPEERIVTLAERLVDAVTSHARLARSVVSGGVAPMLSTSEAAPFRRFAREVSDALAELQKAGRLSTGVDGARVCDAITLLVAAHVYRWAAAPSSAGLSREELRAAVVDGVVLLLAGATGRDPCDLKTGQHRTDERRG